MDLALQTDDHDLAIGTFGRAFYILDDIRPLRSFANKGYDNAKTENIILFDIPDAYQASSRQPDGMRFAANGGPFEGENRGSNARISFYVAADPAPKKEEAAPSKRKGRKAKAKAEEEKPEAKAKKRPSKATMSIINSSGDTIRTRSVSVKKGIVNKTTWNMDRRNPYPGPAGGGGGRFGGGRTAAGSAPREQSAGSALPGTYTVALKYGDEVVTTKVKVNGDPRESIRLSDLQAAQDFIDQVLQRVQAVSQLSKRVRDANGIITKVEAQMKGVDKDKVKDLKKITKETKEMLVEVQAIVSGRPTPAGTQGIFRSSDPTANQMINQVRFAASSRREAPGPNEMDLLKNAEQMISKAMGMADEFFSNQWPKFKTAYDGTDLGFFKDFSGPLDDK